MPGKVSMSENVRKCPAGENALSAKRWPAKEMRAAGRNASDIRPERARTCPEMPGFARPHWRSEKRSQANLGNV
jgi:hypothetical protein